MPAHAEQAPAPRAFGRIDRQAERQRAGAFLPIAVRPRADRLKRRFDGHRRVARKVEAARPAHRVGRMRDRNAQLTAPGRRQAHAAREPGTDPAGDAAPGRDASLAGERPLTLMQFAQPRMQRGGMIAEPVGGRGETVHPGSIAVAASRLAAVYRCLPLFTSASCS